jgi:hypothetical protein
MPKIAIRDGLIVELPAEWTPVFDSGGGLDPALLAAWDAETLSLMPKADAGAVRMARLDWPWLLYRLLSADGVALAERLIQAGAPIAPIDIYPPSLRDRVNFSIKREGLLHVSSGRMHYDLHSRVVAQLMLLPSDGAAPPPAVRATEKPTAPLPAAASPAPATVAPPATKMVRRVEARLCERSAVRMAIDNRQIGARSRL